MADAILTLLVIDDEPQIRRLVYNALVDASLGDIGAGEAAEVRVLEAATGRQGIDLAAAEAPALIVLWVYRTCRASRSAVRSVGGPPRRSSCSRRATPT